MDKQNDYEYVSHPKHYQREGRKECIEEMVDLFGKKTTASWCLLTAYKYSYRMGEKPNEDSARDKAKHDWYIKKAQELMGNEVKYDKD